MSKIKLYVIRHGKTICNENRLYCGKSDVSLSEKGKKEIAKLVKNIKYPSCNLNFTSGAKRANETYELIYPKRKYEKKIGFFEFDFGDFEMKSYDMLKENINYIKWITDKTNEVKCPNGECKNDFYNRITDALKELVNDIISNGEDEALLVCHGGTIGTLLELFSDENNDFYSYQPSFGRGYLLEIDIEDNIKIDILGEI